MSGVSDSTISASNVKTLAPGMVVNGYQLELIIGKGGMGTVFKARQLSTGNPVALKVLEGNDEKHIERFKIEARVPHLANNPNVVKIIDAGVVQSSPPQHFIVMEFVAGRSLEERLKDGPLAVENGELEEVLRQLLNGLCAVHGAGIVHRDLKPDNIRLATDAGGARVVKLVDFGIAKSPTSLGGIRVTRQGIGMGTPLYVAPEQWRGEETTTAADIYALGCIIYECLSGTPLFADVDTVEELEEKKRSPRLPETREGLLSEPAIRGLILECLATKDADRPSAKAIQERLDAFFRRPPLPPPRPVRYFAVTALAVLAVIAGAGWLVADRGSGPVPDPDASVYDGTLSDAVRIDLEASAPSPETLTPDAGPASSSNAERTQPPTVGPASLPKRTAVVEVKTARSGRRAATHDEPQAPEPKTESRPVLDAEIEAQPASEKVPADSPPSVSSVPQASDHKAARRTR